ncbi:hypothetical protein HKBW3S43_01468 [Candidatus Hakubella thermalkaliphila]|uniref:Yip1 domain-containing protein n=1 Tax=Candidatus Hakubella thermalkaliphila TaxID=2754717 RepID=A0A6V8P6T4_9ACTN|nr:Yip1 family protein [Candidatus Hakubella thermalkaliphila]GFP28043.1 hypothetical protein HKBW3S33_01460 [Candidatus Hakubella thermalkaliphila]GFP35679.1 hypothetical protein HKBW3S43_01468 [Candidatus Hakubella thermalkaliphila]
MQKGILEISMGVLTRPTSTIRSICQERPIGWAIVVYLVLNLVAALASIGLGDLGDLEFPEGGGLSPAFLAGISILLIIGFPIIGLLTLAVLTAIWHAVASLLGGKGSYGGLFSGFAFANLPAIFAAPLAVIGLLPGIIGALLFGLGSIGLGLWSLALSIVAVRENYAVSTGRAILIYLLPTAILLVLLGLLVAVVALPIVSGLL